MEMTEAEVEEKDAQADYEEMTQYFADKRAEDSKSLTDKQGTLGNMQAVSEQQITYLAIKFAKDRLNKFYNPKLYKPPAEFAQVRAH